MMMMMMMNMDMDLKSAENEDNDDGECDGDEMWWAWDAFDSPGISPTDPDAVGHLCSRRIPFNWSAACYSSMHLWWACRATQVVHGMDFGRKPRHSFCHVNSVNIQVWCLLLIPNSKIHCFMLFKLETDFCRIEFYRIEERMWTPKHGLVVAKTSVRRSPCHNTDIFESWVLRPWKIHLEMDDLDWFGGTHMT